MIKQLFRAHTAFFAQRTNKLAFFFAGQSQNAEETVKIIDEESRAGGFYRNSIRKINVGDNGKGKFTEHHLIRLIKLTEQASDVPLLFEAYYNYLGHFTLMKNSTVDKMLHKAMSIEAVDLEKVLDVYGNHNHLGYFPSYQVTAEIIRLARANGDVYRKLLNVFLISPLIKFDKEVTDSLISDIKDPSNPQSTFSLLYKVLAQRQAYGLLEGVLTGRELLGHLTTAFSKRVEEKQYRPISNGSEYIHEFITKIAAKQSPDDSLHYELAVAGITAKEQKIFADNLVQIKDQQKIIRALLFLQICPESFRKVAVKHLQNLQITPELRARLNEFKQSSTDPASVQSQ